VSLEGSECADEELATLWQELVEMGELENDVSPDDYITSDQHLATNGVMTLDEIAASAIPATEDFETKAAVVEEPEKPQITNKEARNALDVLRQYIERNVRDPAVLRMCDRLDDVTARLRILGMKQSRLID